MPAKGHQGGGGSSRPRKASREAAGNPLLSFRDRAPSLARDRGHLIRYQAHPP